MFFHFYCKPSLYKDILYNDTLSLTIEFYKTINYFTIRIPLSITISVLKIHIS